MILSLIFLIFFAVSFWLLLKQINWKIRVGIYCIAFTLCILLYSVINSAAGWPTQSAPPKNSVVVWGSVDEPDPLHHDKGSIYLWLIPAQPIADWGLGYKPLTNEPRAYRVPYSRPLHKQLNQALNSVKKGQPVAFILKPKQGINIGSEKYRFYRLPHSGLPPKQYHP